MSNGASGGGLGRAGVRQGARSRSDACHSGRAVRICANGTHRGGPGALRRIPAGVARADPLHRVWTLAGKPADACARRVK